MERSGIPFLKCSIPGSDSVQVSHRREEDPSIPSRSLRRSTIARRVRHGSHAPGSLGIHPSDGSDGNFESICPVCLETVGGTSGKKTLRGLNTHMRAIPTALATSHTFGIPHRTDGAY